jgi:hypothetical protein
MATETIAQSTKSDHESRFNLLADLLRTQDETLMAIENLVREGSRVGIHHTIDQELRRWSAMVEMILASTIAWQQGLEDGDLMYTVWNNNQQRAEKIFQRLQVLKIESHTTGTKEIHLDIIRLMRTPIEAWLERMADIDSHLSK